MSNGRIVIAGGSGFLGQVLAEHFTKAEREVIILTRNPQKSNEVVWDAATIGPWAEQLEGAEALINLTGRTVNCRYNAQNRKEIMESRVKSTRTLGEVIRQCKRPPRVWLNASTATIYKHTLGTAHDERGEIGASPEAYDAFSIEVAQQWFWGMAKIACFRCCGAWRGLALAGGWAAAGSMCHGFTSEIFAARSIGFWSVKSSLEW